MLCLSVPPIVDGDGVTAVDDVAADDDDVVAAPVDAAVVDYAVDVGDDVNGNDSNDCYCWP